MSTGETKPTIAFITTYRWLNTKKRIKFEWIIYVRRKWTWRSSNCSMMPSIPDVLCYLCGTVLDKAGHTVKCCIGCTKKRCNSWACRKCAGFDTLKAAKACDDWICAQTTTKKRGVASRETIHFLIAQCKAMRKAARVVSGLLWSVTAIFSVLFAFFLFEASRGGGKKDPGKKVALMIVLVMVAAIMLSVALVSALTATGWQLTHRSHANAGNTHPPNTKDSNF